MQFVAPFVQVPPRGCLLPAPMSLSHPLYAPIAYPLHTLTLFIVILQVVAAIEAGGKVNELNENKEVRW